MLGTQEVVLDLKGGRSVWELHEPRPTFFEKPRGSVKTDIVIVGGGITGAFLAERLTRVGREVLVIDRHAPQRGSTAASTALLQWEIDRSLLELADQIGSEPAADVYRRSHQTLISMQQLVHELRLRCEFEPRPTVFLAGDILSFSDLTQEHLLRQRVGLPGDLLDQTGLCERFGFDRTGAIVSPGSAEADPIKLARGLMDAAVRRGAHVIAPVLIEEYDCTSKGVVVVSKDGTEFAGRTLILANGYEMPSFVPASAHRIVSTWALATPPQAMEVLWPERALIWEASTPYFYMRTTPENRIIIGGEDDEITSARDRDAAIPAKTERLLAKLGELAPAAVLKAETAWAGFFGETHDGLPLLGRVPGMPNCFAAYGYGGNGCTFSALAADMLLNLISGESDPLEEVFAIDR